MLVMDTRCRAGPLRPAVCDGMRKYVSRAGGKDSSAVTVSASLRKAYATVTPACTGRSGAGKDSGASATNVALPAKADAEARMTRFESNVSRPSTPVTESSSWCPSSGSSFATSVYADAESGCPKDDALGDRRSESSAPTPGDMKKFDEADMAAAKGALNPHMLRQSHLRHCMFARSGTASHSSTDSDEDCDHIDDNYGDDDDDNDCSGENDTLDVAIIEALDGDLSLAAFLIPLLHRDMRNAVRRKVEAWQIDAGAHTGPEDGESSRGHGSGRHSGSGSHDSASTSHSRGGHASGQERKRRRRPSDSENGQDDEEEEEQGGGDDYDPSTGWEKGRMPLLACPFNKMNPVKYGIQHGNGTGASSRQNQYRACAGPGFKSIQRLKEHLKRKHTPVQCDRCYYIFPGSDKTACMRQLSEHRRSEVPCERGDPLLREGISEEQWAALDIKSRKKNQEMHKVEKWYEIWRVLFPNTTVPDTPWYANATPTQYQTPSLESEAFADLFLSMLNHKLQMGDIGFPDCNKDEVAQRLRNLVQQTFRTYVSLHGPLSRTSDMSSSQGTHDMAASSLVGGSSTHQSHPTTNSTSQHLSNTTRTTAPALSPAQMQHMLQMQMAVASNLYAVPGMAAGNGVPMMPGQSQQNVAFVPVPTTTLPVNGMDGSAYTHLPDEFFAWQAAAGAQAFGGGVGSSNTMAAAMATGPGAHYEYGPGNEVGFFNDDGAYNAYTVG